MLPLIAVTQGDPAGIGPHVGVAAVGDARWKKRARLLYVGDAWVVSRFVRSTLRVNALTDLSEFDPRPEVLNVLHTPHPGIHRLKPGQAQALGGESALLALRTALALVTRRQVSALVTGPISKQSLALAGVRHPGHTELLAHWAGVPQVEMLMTAGPCRALLLTRHQPLASVGPSLKTQHIVSSIRLTDRWWRKTTGARALRWGLLAFNPHGGDGGLIGHEEIDRITPAVIQLRRAGLRVDGPLPADVGWARHAKGEFDLLACLYHDQAMIPLKTLHPQEVVNVTVGLPYIRTSPGHGTAFDLAATRPNFREADPTATLAAVETALQLLGT